MCEELPFYGATANEIHDQIVNKELDVSSAKWENVSEEAKDFLRRGLEKDPNGRANCEEMLFHKWLVDESSISHFMMDNMSPI